MKKFTPEGKKIITEAIGRVILSNERITALEAERNLAVAEVCSQLNISHSDFDSIYGKFERLLRV